MFLFGNQLKTVNWTFRFHFVTAAFKVQFDNIWHTICENKNDGCSFKDNTIAAVIKTNGVTFEITNTATPDFIKNLIEAFNHA